MNVPFLVAEYANRQLHRDAKRQEETLPVSEPSLYVSVSIILPHSQFKNYYNILLEKYILKDKIYINCCEKGSITHQEHMHSFFCPVPHWQKGTMVALLKRRFKPFFDSFKLLKGSKGGGGHFLIVKEHLNPPMHRIDDISLPCSTKYFFKDYKQIHFKYNTNITLPMIEILYKEYIDYEKNKKNINKNKRSEMIKKMLNEINENNLITIDAKKTCIIEHLINNKLTHQTGLNLGRERDFVRLVLAICDADYKIYYKKTLFNRISLI